jgi:asparagine synthase (glutamine-hydrolysing)
MCGITGYYTFEEVEDELLSRATDALQQRGPDMHGIWKQGHVGLGHRRLSILDTSERGRQPMQAAGGRYQLVFNGEIYNFRELRKELEQKGHSFESGTDTEVLLAALIELGKGALEHFNGFFAFAFYDVESDYLLVARDRFGIKPLVYHHGQKGVFFASELKSLLQYGLSRELDRQALNLYLELTYIPAPFTIFQQIRKLEPGHYVEVKKGQFSTESYYKLPFPSKDPFETYESASQSIRSALEKSVQARMIADVPLGTFLSGGIDSSIISAIAAKHTSDLHTFSIGYRDHPFFDETHFAESVARKIGSQHHTFKLSNEDLLEYVEQTVGYFDEPFADSSALPMFILSHVTRKHVTVALSGDGADEIFSGYNKHGAWVKARQRNAVNALIRNFGFLLRLLPRSRQNKWANLFRQLEKYRRLLTMSPKERYWHLAAFIPAVEVEKLLLNEMRVSIEEFKGELLQFVDDDQINTVLALDVHLVLAGDMLTKVDWMSMANSLEVRVPFLDHHVVEEAFRVPEAYKIRGKDRKFILKDTFRKDLPDELFNRGKHGFEVPLLDWFRRELASDLDENVFNQDKIDDQGIFDRSSIMEMKKQLSSSYPGDVHIKIWQQYVFQKWWGRYCR